MQDGECDVDGCGVVKPFISVVCPMYNESERIHTLLQDVKWFVQEHPGYLCELICVDDASKDGTVEVVMQMTRNFPVSVQVVPCAENKGKWATLHDGMKLAKGEVVLLLDADGSASVFEILGLPNGTKPVLLRQDVVKRRQVYMGSRFKGKVIGKTLMRAVVSRAYAAFARTMIWYAVGRTTIDDPQCPWKLFAKGLVHDVQWHVERFAGDCELIMVLSRRGAFFNTKGIKFMHMKGSKVRPDAITSMVRDTVKVARVYKGKKYI